jgi:PAS domain S-box-containing protein
MPGQIKNGAWRILIVDDDPDYRADLRRLLLCGSDRSYVFAEVALGRECLEAARDAEAKPIACILLDYRLPDMDGLDVLRELSGTTGEQPCPIIVLTGSDGKIGPSVVRAGAQDYIRKSGLTSETLTRSVENAVERFALLNERLSAQAALRESEYRYRHLFDSIDEGFCVIELIYAEHEDPVDWVYLEVNPAFERHTGMVDVCGKRITELLSHVEPAWFERYGRVASTRQSIRFQIQVEQLDARWIDLFVMPLGAPGSRRVAVLFTDITARVRSDDALRISEERFRSTFDNVAIGIADLGIDGRWLRFNPAVCRMTGRSALELIGMSLADVTHVEDWSQVQPRLLQLLAGKIANFTADMRVVRPDGRALWSSVTLSVRSGATGDIQGLIVALEDVSTKKAVLEELERQQRFVERLTYVMPGTLHLYDFDLEREVWVNRHIGLTLGYSPTTIAESAAQFLAMHMAPPEYENLRAHFARVAASSDSEVIEYEYRVRGQDGRWRWFRNSDTIFRRALDGKALELVGTASEVTQRRLDEAELHRALSAAENANRAKSAFLSSMSHELRSPLNAVLGFAQLLESGKPALMPAQQECTAQILKAGWYLLQLINEVLDLSKIEAGRVSISAEALSLADVLPECEALVETQARNANISLTFTDLSHACRVVADRVRLKQVFVNLLSNGIKYNRAGGAVHITCHPVKAGRLRISFADTGAGLTSEQVAKLFHPFERLGQERGVIEGTGVGLVVSKRLAELMDGELGVESVPGTGSTFWVDLPTAPDRPGPSAGTVKTGDSPPGSSSKKRQTFTVLCVEDNPANLMLVERILSRRSDINLLSANDGVRGLEVAREVLPDIVLMDVNLPGATGFDALTVLSSDPVTAHIPVIAISANAMPRDVEIGLRAGFFRYLTKPIEIKPFNDAVDAALQISKDGQFNSYEEAHS